MGARRRLPLVRTLAVLLISLALGAAVAGCGGSAGEEGSSGAPTESEQQPASAEEPTTPAPEETQGGGEEESSRTATVRLSGTEGMIYAGTYGNLDGSEYAEGILEGEPVEFTVRMRESGFDVVNASFAKPNGNVDGTLVIQILSGGEVVAEQEAEAQYGTLNLTWSSDA